jgi:hypothetical protein
MHRHPLVELAIGLALALALGWLATQVFGAVYHQVETPGAILASAG